MTLIIKEIALEGVEVIGDTFTGKATVYNVYDAENDRVMPGAFKSISKRTPALLFGHDHKSIPVGKFTDIKDTPEALIVTGSLTKGGSMTKDLSASLAHGSLKGLSVGMAVKKAVRNEMGGQDVLEADLFEVSLTALPSNPMATIDMVKSINSNDVDALDGMKGIEAYLKDLGLSKNTIKALIHKIKAMDIVEDEEENQEDDAEESLKAINEALKKLIAK
jgi:HK97 family phage prohead protease